MGTLKTSYVGALDAAKSAENGSAGFSRINNITLELFNLFGVPRVFILFTLHARFKEIRDWAVRRRPPARRALGYVVYVVLLLQVPTPQRLCMSMELGGAVGT